jgi:hypothetical protein
MKKTHKQKGINMNDQEIRLEIIKNLIQENGNNYLAAKNINLLCSDAEKIAKFVFTGEGNNAVELTSSNIDSTDVDYEKFEKILLDVIAINEEYQEKIQKFHRKIESTITNVDFMYMYGTIKFDIGRQTFKTTFVCNHSNADTAFIVEKQAMIDCIKESSFFKCKEDINIFTPEQFMQNPCAPYKTIYVEHPSYCFKTKESLNAFYEHVGAQGIATIILLGDA